MFLAIEAIRYWDESLQLTTIQRTDFDTEALETYN